MKLTADSRRSLRPSSPEPAIAVTTRARTPTIRSVALPAEHGGWGLTLEPAVLGVLLAPSLAGVLLGVAALLAFLARTPLRLLLRRLRAERPAPTPVSDDRARLARRVALLELVAMGVALLAVVALTQDASWMWPLVIAGPLFAIAFWFDLRAASRHLAAEIVGSLAVAAVAPMATLAGGGAMTLALGAWLILGARVFSSIPHVRAQVQRIHGRVAPSGPTRNGDLAALAIAAAAVLLEPAMLWGGVAVVGLVLVQRVTLARPPRPARVLGARQMVLGFTVVGFTAVGTWLA